jgi:ankyrin repeat protein
MAGKQPKRNDRPGVDRYGRTPLHEATIDGDVVRVKALLTSGIDPGAADDNGWTPLHFAAQESALEVVRLLLEAGATVDPRDAHGNTPLFKAVFNSRGEGEIIKLLRASGADPFVNNAYGVSPLKLARTIANFDVRQFFSDLPEDHDAEPGAAPDNGGKTA